jgi:glutamate racemase
MNGKSREMSPSSPIVVLDSGLGGLSVAREIRYQLPKEDILYFGDTARLPYGSKTAQTVSGFVQQIIRYLLPHNPKHVVIACNTATALALPAARAAFPSLTITGVVEPGAKAAVVAAGAKQVPVIGVIATEATVKSKAYERAVHRRRNHARMLLKPTPLLVPMIEEGRLAGDPVVKLVLEQYLKPMLQLRMDVLVLGCTHYPIYKDLMQKIVGGAVPVIDSARLCADDVARRLKASGLLRNSMPSLDGEAASEQRGTLRCFVTDDPQRFARLAPRFIGMPIDEPTWVAPDELYGPAQGGDWPIRVPA